MATVRPFAYTPTETIDGTIQVGDLAVGYPTTGFTYSPLFWNGPDEELGYVIAVPVSGNTQPTNVPGLTASVGFYRSKLLTEESFVFVTNRVFFQNFTTGDESSTWLTDNGYWNSWTATPSNLFFILTQNGSILTAQNNNQIEYQH